MFEHKVSREEYADLVKEVHYLKKFITTKDYLLPYTRECLTIEERTGITEDRMKRIERKMNLLIEYLGIEEHREPEKTYFRKKEDD